MTPESTTRATSEEDIIVPSKSFLKLCGKSSSVQLEPRQVYVTHIIMYWFLILVNVEQTIQWFST
jgi:hypothetical protein